MTKYYYITENYRDRWSKLPGDKCELYRGDVVQIVRNPGMGSLTLKQEPNEEEVHLAAYSAHILKPIPEEKLIRVKKSSCFETDMGTPLYSYYVTFPKRIDWAYTLKATEEGWLLNKTIWEEAGYYILEVK